MRVSSDQSAGGIAFELVISLGIQSGLVAWIDFDVAGAVLDS
jgi:hypothetical protein